MQTYKEVSAIAVLTNMPLDENAVYDTDEDSNKSVATAIPAIEEGNTTHCTGYIQQEGFTAKGLTKTPSGETEVISKGNNKDENLMRIEQVRI
jgi:hypothetical protein